MSTLVVLITGALTEGKSGPVTEQTAETYAATFDMNVLGVILNCMRWTPEMGARLSVKATDPQ